jgi:hypothetical protein
MATPHRLRSRFGGTPRHHPSACPATKLGASCSRPCWGQVVGCRLLLCWEFLLHGGGLGLFFALSAFGAVALLVSSAAAFSVCATGLGDARGIGLHRLQCSLGGLLRSLLQACCWPCPASRRVIPVLGEPCRWQKMPAWRPVVLCHPCRARGWPSTCCTRARALPWVLVRLACRLVGGDRCPSSPTRVSLDADRATRPRGRHRLGPRSSCPGLFVFLARSFYGACRP